MPPSNRLPTWAPRVKQQAVRRLYESDAQGLLDEDLLNEVGWGLYERCQSFIAAVEAARGRARCPECSTPVPHHHQPGEVVHCSQCGWENTWQAYFKTFQHQQLSGADEVLALFQDYIDHFPGAREPQEKMLRVDILIHGFHYYIKFGPTRAAGINLIEGRYYQVVEFLDTLSYGPGSTPGLREHWQEWRAIINHTAEVWQNEKLRRPIE